jgi:hypothetical protein
VQITSSSSPSADTGGEELRAALLVKKQIKEEQMQQLALIESARATGPNQPLDTRLVGRLLNEKA